jgi:hypothetical protein
VCYDCYSRERLPDRTDTPVASAPMIDIVEKSIFPEALKQSPAMLR